VAGRYHLTYEPLHPVPVLDWLRPQARFAHLFAPGAEDRLEHIQRQVDADWDTLVARCEADAARAA
jgi:pyruvate ferredoxin oxidoreductase beta subunit